MFGALLPLVSMECDGEGWNGCRISFNGIDINMLVG